MPIKLDPVDYDPFEVVPEQLQYEPVDHDPFAPQKTTPGDYSRSLALGLNRFGQTVGRAIDVVGNLDPTRLFTESGEGLVDRAGQNIEAFYKEKEQEDYDALSPAMKASMQLRYTEDTDKSWKDAPVENFKSLFAGDAWRSPSKVVGSLLQSAPSTVVGMGTGGMITHGLIKQGIKGLSPGMAGVIGGFIGEGGTASVESGKDVYDMVVNAPHDVLSQTEEYQKAWNGLEGEGMSSQARDRQARELVADHAAMKTMAMVFGATGTLGSVSGHYMGKLIGGEATGGLTRKIVTGGGTEALQEAPQSGFEIFENNVQKKKYVNPEQDLWEGVKEGSVEGTVQGFVMGLGAGAGGSVAGKITKNTRQNLLDDEPQGDKGFAGETLDENGDIIEPGETLNPETAMGNGPAEEGAASQPPPGSTGPTAEEQQWAADIQAQRDGTYRSPGVPIQALALGAQQQRQREMERQEALEQEALRQEQEALNSPGTHINQGQDEVDRGIAEFRRVRRQEEELRRIQAIRSGQTDEVRAQREQEEIEAQREAQRQKFFEREEQRIEGGTALAGWQAPEPIFKNPNAPTRAELAKRKAFFDAKARELGIEDSNLTNEEKRERQRVERETPRGLPTPAFAQPRAIGGGIGRDQVMTGPEAGSVKSENSLITEQREISEQPQDATPAPPATAMAGYSPPVQHPVTPEAKAKATEIEQAVTSQEKGEVKALPQSGDQTIDISVASDVGVAPTKPRVSKESFNKAISEQSHNENSPLNKYLFTEDTPENIEYILSGKSKHPRNLVYWQQGRLHHNSPNKSVIVLDISKIDPSKLQTERDGVGEYLIDAKDIRGAVVGSYKNQYQLRDNFTDLVDNTPAAPDASAPSGVAPAESSQSDVRTQAINDFVETIVAPDLKRARENGIDVSQEQIDKVKDDQRTRAEEFVAAIESKDFGAMKDRLHRGNKASLKLFSAITGLSTRTQKETDESIRSLDPVKYDEWIKAKKQKFDKAVADKKAADKEKKYKAMLEAQTNYDSNGKPITFEQHIKSLLDNGYTDIEVTEGKFPTTTLIKYENGGKGRILKSQVFRKKIEQEYVQKMQDQYAEARIAEDIARDEKDRQENPDKYITPEQEEQLFGKQPADDDLQGAIGRNPDGKRVYVDENGIRSYQDGNVRSNQPVSLAPTSGGGIKTKSDNAQILYNRGRTDYLTTEEIADFERAAEQKAQKEKSLAQEMTDKMVSTNDLIKSKGYTTRSETGGRKTLIKDGKDVFTGTASQVSEWIKGGGSPVKTPAKPDGYGKKNKVFTEDAAAKARELLRKKFNTQLNAGLDPEMVQAGITLAGYHIEAGARTFIEYSKAMIADLGEGVKPYLRSFYEGVRYFPGMDSKGMTDGQAIDKIDLDRELASTNIEGVQNEDNAGRPGTQGVDTEGGQEVSGGRDGTLAGDRGDRNPTEPRGTLEVSQTEDVPQTKIPGDIETDGIRPGMQDAGDGGQVPGGRDAMERRPNGSVEGMADEGPGGTGRSRLGNYHIEDPELLIGGTPKKRFSKNRQAIETYNELVDENRDPTREERDILAGYIGWGAFGQELFQGTWDKPVTRDGWTKENEWLREHLGKSAWESAQRSILNAHYTDPPTVTATWDIIRKMGFKGGRVLEPSAGVGNFFGLMPKDLKESSSLTGIELDETTAGIAKMLYPDANIQQMGYEKSKTADNFYDVVVGNWPFAKDGPADRRYNKFRLSLHDYFFVKALDQVRPGGFVVGITSSGTMDKKTRLSRLQMSKRADLVAAFRMPSGAFKEYAGTSVVADLVIFQKRQEGAAPNHQSEWGESVPLLDKKGNQVKASDGRSIFVNEYWANNPDNVLGEMTVGHGTTQGREGMVVNRPRNYENLLTSIKDRVPGNILTKRTETDNIRHISNNTEERQNSITTSKGELYVVRGERLANLDDVSKYKVKNEAETAKRTDQVNSLVGIRNTYGKLLDTERDGGDGVEDTRKELKTLYDNFVKKHGPINESFGIKIFKKVSDPLYPALVALENNVGTNRQPVFEPSRIFTESTQRTKPAIKNPTISEAFVYDRNENALSVDLESIAEKASSTVDKVRAELTKNNAIFETPNGNFEVADLYLSGNVKQKLREAKEAQAAGRDMKNNISALEKIIPEDTPYFQIEVGVGATWVPQEVYQNFIGDMGNLPADVRQSIRLTPSINGWIVKFDNASLLNSRQDVQAMWVTPGSSFTKVVSAAFTGSTITIRTKDQDGNISVDTENSLRANEKVDELRERFKDWIWEDVDRRVAMEQQYNEVMNAFATPQYDGSFLNFDGMALQLGENEFNLRQHQVNAIWRGIANGRGLYAHEVGTGKTFTMAGIAVESRRYGLAKKPLILAHNANSESVANDINVMYPGAKVLYVDNLSPKTIQSKLYQIANDDWDAIVMPHSLMPRLTLSEETLNSIAAEEIAILEEEAIESASEEGFDISGILDDEEALRKVRGATTAKELVKQRNRIISTIQRQAHESSKEGAVTFENLGIDMIIVDEAHVFKKPPLSTRMKVKGLNTSATSTSIGLHFLTSYVKKINNGKGVHTFTGTPITNTLNEVFNQMRYVMSDKMEDAGIQSWDAWFNTFAGVESDIEITAAGDYQMVTRLTEFNNVTELRRFSGQYMDIVFADDMPEFKPRPTRSGKTMKDKTLTDSEKDELLNGRVDGGVIEGRPYKKVVNEVADMSPDQEEILRDVMERALSFRQADGKTRYSILKSGDRRSPIIVEGDAAKAGFDARLYDKNLSDHPNNKINRSVRNIMEHYLEHDKSTQVVFMEKGFSDVVQRTKTRDGVKTVTRHAAFNAANDLVEKLIKAGIPSEQIALVTGSTSKNKRQQIAEAMNRAEIRVVIGQTSTLGTGVNMQENLRAMHHLDAPWMPGELEQRNGRGHRQGNRWNTVMEYRYITNRIDGKRWQVLAKKDKMIKDFLKAKEGVRSVSGDVLDLNESNELDDITASFSDAAGDARIMVRAKLEKDVEKLLRRERTHDQGTVAARTKAEQLTRQMPGAEKRLKNLKDDSDHYVSQKDKPFSITLDGKDYTKKEEANAALEKIAIKLSRDLTIGEDKVVGKYLGFELVVEASSAGRQKGINFLLQRITVVNVKPSVSSLNAHLRHLEKRYEKGVQEIADIESSIEKLKSVSNEKFGQSDLLKRKRELLNQVEADLQAYPDPPPAWLAQGAPIGTDIYVDGKPATVDGHRRGEHDYYLLVTQEDGRGDAISYKEATDENGIQIYEIAEAPQVIAEQAPVKADSPIAEESGTIRRDRVHADSRMTQFSTTPTAPGKSIALPQIKKMFKGQTVTTNKDGSVSVRLKNGAGVRVKTVQQVAEGKYLLSTESGKMDQNGLIAGKYFNNEIELVDGVADGKTFTHEVEHWLEDVRVLTKGDTMVMDAKIRYMDKQGTLPFKFREDQRENRANFLAYYLANRETFRGTAIGRIIQKVADFLDAMVNLGRSSVRKIARGIESEKIFSREAESAPGGKVQNSTTLNTNTKAFRDWFGDSEIVDANGEPLVVYHSTDNDFSAFDPKFAGKNTDGNATDYGLKETARMGFWFSGKDISKQTKKTLVIPTYLHIENPYRTDLLALAGEIKEIGSAKALREQLEDDGYDGISLYDQEFNTQSYVAFNPTQIKSINNRGTWSQTDPRIQYSTVQNDQKENEKIVKSLFKQKKTFTESVKDMADKAKSEEERQLAKDKVIANTLDNLHFIKTRLGDRVYKMHRVLTGIKSATFARFLLDGPLSWVGDALQVTDKGKGVIPFLQSIGPDYQNLFLWIAARRAEQLEADGREFWLTKDKRDAIDAKVGTHAKSGKSWEALNKRFQTINKNVLDIAEQAGLINAESRAMWESDFYIPFYRIFENEATKAEFLSGPVAANKHISAQIRRLKGSEAKIGDLLENSMANWMHLVDAAARNKAKAAAFEVGVETGIFTELTKKDLVNVLGVHNETRYAVMKPDGERASSIFDTKEEAEAWAYTLSDKYNKKYTIEPRKNTIIKFGNMKDLGVQSFQKDGKPVYFKTDDVDLYNSMCELDAKQFRSFIMKMFGGSKRLLTKGATFGTMFRINNALRDTLHTSIVTDSFVPFVDTAIGFTKSWLETKEWREMMSSGFGFGSSYIHSDDPQAGSKYVRKIIAREGRGALSRILHSPGKILEVWEKIGTASENAARVQHYSRLRKKGMSVFDAGFESRDLMDFSMRGGGNSIQLLTRTLPFLGARIQGNYKLGRAAKKNPVRFLLKGSMLTMASLALWGAFKDDDRYKELPDWDKFLFMHFWIGDKHFRIPSPFEVGVLFCSLPVTIANIVNGNEDMKFLGEWAKTSAGDVLGIDITPQLTKPLVELTTNKNTFTGRKIVPDYMEGLPKPEQYHHYTSETAREIGKRLNVSPLQVEHLIRGYTSTMGMMALSALDDAFVRDLFGYPSRAKGGQKPWGVSRLVSDAKKPATNTKYLTGFYESAKQVADAKRTYNHYLKTTQLDKAADILKEKGLLMALSPATNKIKSRLALINDEMRRVQRSNEYTPSEKEKRLDTLMSERNRAVKAGFEGIRKAKAKQKVAG